MAALPLQDRLRLLAAGIAAGLLAAALLLLALAAGPRKQAPEPRWILSEVEPPEIDDFPIGPDAESDALPEVSFLEWPAHEPAAPEAFDLRCVGPQKPFVAFNADKNGIVEEAFRWLAEHQLPDGGWSFDHRGGRCGGRCSQAGSLAEARHAATGLVLLAFLGAGQTHREGAYKNVVREGARFLLLRQARQEGGSLWEFEGGMASHGIASYALCELYAMTHDKNLLEPAQQALCFSFAAQTMQGGWGCDPGGSPNLRASGWQLLALRSGHLGYLDVPAENIRGASRYFSSLGPSESETAIAVAARHHLAIGSRAERLRRIERLAARRPRADDWQGNFFAGDPIHAAGGDAWRDWQRLVREELFAAQARSGHEKGSWFALRDPAARAGGRVYSTALAVLILHTYRKKWPGGLRRAEDDFKL